MPTVGTRPCLSAFHNKRTLYKTTKQDCFAKFVENIDLILALHVTCRYNSTRQEEHAGTEAGAQDDSQVVGTTVSWSRLLLNGNVSFLNDKEFVNGQ
jgi:hypothetical protein